MATTITFAEGDIEGAILTAYDTLIPQKLTTAYPTTDKLRIKTYTQAPLQADPIASAPYLVIAPAYEIGRMPVEDPYLGGFELGAPELWRTYFKGVCGTPRMPTKIQAYQAINELSRRVERTIIQNLELANITNTGPLRSGDGSEWIDSMIPQRMWTRTVRRIYGGDGQFYGQALMIWNYNFRRLDTNLE